MSLYCKGSTMPTLSPPRSFHVLNDPSFYESHQNLVQSHHIRYDSFLRHSPAQNLGRQRPSHALHLLQNSIQLPPPPQMLLHKVWILDCKSCGAFFTNRGMKAVLLLRPNVPLYSTDALPANCSAYSSPSDSDESRLSPPLPQIGESVRTCECLTQTLCCHGCGNAVGYMIVIPCQRCTSSMSASNRSTNGHRFVFHSSEIYASERHYIYGEPGVISLHSQRPPSCPAHPHTIYPTPASVSVPPASANNPDPAQISYHDHLPTPPADSSNEERRFFFMSDEGNNASSPPGSPIASRSLSPSPPLPALLPSGAFTPPSQIYFSSPMPPPPPMLAKLKPGEVLYWHHLTRNGEIPGVEIDDRARGKRYTQDGSKESLSDDIKWTLEGGVMLRGMPIVCGR